MRVSSPTLAAAFIDGARAQGADVVDYGMCGTDMLYFAVARDGLDGGAQITASHNPKAVQRHQDGAPRGVSALGRRRHRRDPRHGRSRGTIPAPTRPPGGLRDARRCSTTTSTRSCRSSTRRVIKPFNVVLDAGSGMAGLVAPRLFDRLPCKTTRLCFDDRRHVPEPRSQSAHRGEPPRHRRARRSPRRRDIGIAWDGDADRCFFIDGSGEFIAGDFITALLAEAFLMQVAGREDRLRRARQLRRQGHRGALRRHGADEPRRPRVHQAADARRERHLRRRGHRALLLPRLLLRRQRLHPGAADPRADVAARARRCATCWRRCARSTSSPARSTPRSASMAVVAARLARSGRRATRTATPTRSTGSRPSSRTGTSTCGASNTEPLLRLNLEALTPELMEQKTRRSAGGDSEDVKTAGQLGGSCLDGDPETLGPLDQRCYVSALSGLSIVVMSWLPKPVRRVRFP